MQTLVPVTDADILLEIVAQHESRLSPEAARQILTWKFTPRQRARMEELADRGNGGELSAEERQEMDRFARISTMLSTMHSKARLALQAMPRSA
jgi:hypothetical protein